jgi:hypothetical protein
MSSSFTKSELVAELARLIGLKEVPPMSTGSTEPRSIFEAVSEGLGLGTEDQRLTKPQIAAHIVRSAGLPWLPDFESRGGTVTRAGLHQVVLAVRFFLHTTPAN